MIDLQNQQARGRLRKAIKTSNEALVPFRQTHKQLIRDHCGSWYGTNVELPKTLVNLINQTARIYTVVLAANNPKVQVSTPVPDFWPFAKRFEVNLNKLIADMNLDKTFRAVVLDAFFCIGCACVMMRDSDTEFHAFVESEEDVWLDPGEPWLNRVSLDDLILDMTARDLTKMRFCGHRYRADFEKVKSERGYDKAVQKQITPTKKNSTDNPDSARDVAAGDVDDDELKPMLWLEDIWIPENNSIATFAVDFDLPPLIEWEWRGSQAGPYKFLSLGLVPDNIIPCSPAMNLKPLHDLQNRLHRRMEDDSDAHRKINVFSPEGADDAEVLRQAKRNDWVKMRDPKSVNQVELGGIDPREQGFSLFIQDEYDRFAGNLRAMGGLGAQAATLGQEEIVQGNVSRMEAGMQLAVVNFAAECCWDLGALMWNDETLEIQSSVKVGSNWMGIAYNSHWSPERRVGNFEDYQFQVEPYSMVYKTPTQKLAELYETLDRIAPLWPMFKASGASMDVEAIYDEIARLLNRPEFKRFITFANPAAELGGDQNTVRQSPVTTRNTVRKNIPTGGTSENRSAILQQVLGGSSGPQVNPAQAASVGRPA